MPKHPRIRWTLAACGLAIAATIAVVTACSTGPRAGEVQDEAMQAGLPVLASAVGELSNSIEHGRCGWLVPPRNADDLAVGLAGLLSEPDRLAVMGQAARTRVVERFGEERFITTAGTILERLAGIVQARRSASGPGNAPGA